MGHQAAGWRRALDRRREIGLVKPVRKRLIIMVRATLDRCYLQGCAHLAIAMNIKQSIAPQRAYMCVRCIERYEYPSPATGSGVVHRR